MEKTVSLKNDIEKKIEYRSCEINKKFIYRVMAFSRSGTNVVDLKPDINEFPEARFICRIKPDFFCKFFQNMMPHSEENYHDKTEV